MRRLSNACGILHCVHNALESRRYEHTSKLVSEQSRTAVTRLLMVGILRLGMRRIIRTKWRGEQGNLNEEQVTGKGPVGA